MEVAEFWKTDGSKTNNSNLLLPFDYYFIQVFESNEELQSYVTSDTYGEWVDGVYQPKVAIAVVFEDGKDDKSYDYTIRVNSTNYNSEEQSVSEELYYNEILPRLKTTFNSSIYIS